MKIDEIILLDSDADKFNDLLEYYNTEISPEDKYTKAELASQLLQAAVKEEWFKNIFKQKNGGK